MNKRILIVDDEAGIRESLSMGLTREGFEVETAPDAAAGRAAAARFRPDLALVDVRMPGEDGLAALKDLRAEGVTVVMISGNATLKEAVQAVRDGAFDFLEKPLSIDKVLVTIQRALDYEQIKARVDDLAGAAREGDPVGDSPAWRKAMQTSARVAPTDAAVLITGESGTGKERVAEWIHARSLRAGGPFVAINVAALPETLVEAELFGHEKGAFTGAAAARRGKFELADGGTLFLDEIGDMPAPVQPKLLRALEAGEIQRLGSERMRKVDVRVIAATHRDLAERIKTGEFREDLFFRLNVIPIELPPLRDRGGDILMLAENFLAQFAARYRKPATALTESARRLLQAAPWPGNVREIRNVCERLVILGDGDSVDDLLESMLPHAAPAGESGGELRRKLADYERELIRQTLSECGGNHTAAAQKLGISRSQLYRKLEKFSFS